MSASRLPRLKREMRESARLSIPLVLGQLSAVAMNVVDTLIAGHHSALALAGVAVGSAVWSLAIMIALGVMMALPPSVSHLAGAGRRAEIGPLFRQALWLALALGFGLFVLVRQSGPLLAAMGIDAEVLPGARDFLGGLSWGAPALVLYLAFRYLSEGVALTRPTMVFGIGGLLLLIPLGIGLMHGVCGLPALGPYGLGLATAFVLWCQAAGMGLYLWSSPRYADLRLFDRVDPPRAAAIAELLRIGLPMGVSIFMEGSLFVATALIIGTLGTVAVAAHQVAINIASACFMVPLGIAMATTVRVGHASGAGDASAVRWAAGGGYALTALAQVGSALLLFFGASLIARAYTDDAEVAALAAQLMALAAVFQLSDGLQAASGGALRGLKDTRVPMVITVLAYWCVGMPLGWWLGIAQGAGPQGMWIGLIAGLSVAAVLLTLRFSRLSGRDAQSRPSIRA
ncbi:MAG: MATE family efflux transporter [Lysobacteraceae bacterium]